MVIIRENNLETTVAFTWSKEYGECIDCGLPAAYALEEMFGPKTKPGILCSVCAAWNVSAGSGAKLSRLAPEDDD